jgi:hypothetical protein
MLIKTEGSRVTHFDRLKTPAIALASLALLTLITAGCSNAPASTSTQEVKSPISTSSQDTAPASTSPQKTNQMGRKPKPGEEYAFNMFINAQGCSDVDVYLFQQGEKVFMLAEDRTIKVHDTNSHDENLGNRPLKTNYYTVVAIPKDGSSSDVDVKIESRRRKENLEEMWQYFSFTYKQSDSPTRKDFILNCLEGTFQPQN